MSLSNAMNTALSGMTAQTARLSGVADNIANMDTPGYERRVTRLVTQSDGGVQASVIAQDPSRYGPSGDGIDPAGEITGMLEAEAAYKANAAVFEAGADLWQVLATIKR